MRRKNKKPLLSEEDIDSRKKNNIFELWTIWIKSLRLVRLIITVVVLIIVWSLIDVYSLENSFNLGSFCKSIKNIFINLWNIITSTYTIWEFISQIKHKEK
jgi:hypothetical protein